MSNSEILRCKNIATQSVPVIEKCTLATNLFISDPMFFGRYELFCMLDLPLKLVPLLLEHPVYNLCYTFWFSEWGIYS